MPKIIDHTGSTTSGDEENILHSDSVNKLCYIIIALCDSREVRTLARVGE